MTKPKIVSYLSQKGGVGKSSLAVHLAVALKQRDINVGIIDIDYLQRTVANVWYKLRPTDDVPCLTCEAKDLKPAIKHMMQQNPDLDVIFIDTPGRHDPGTPKAVEISDLVVVPVTPDSVFEIEPMGRTVDTIKKAGKADQGLIVLTRTDPLRNGFESSDTVAGRKGLERYGLPIAKQAIGFYKAFKNTVARGGTVLEKDPGSKAAGQVRALAAEIDKILYGED